MTWKPFDKLLPMMAILAIGSGCGTAINGAEDALTIQEQHPISVDRQMVTLILTPISGSGTLSDIDHVRLRTFADGYLNQGHGPLMIIAPQDHLDAHLMAGNVERALQEIGVTAGAVKKTNYAKATGRDVVLTYAHYVATPSACGVWTDTRRRDRKNLRSPNFGCATQNNLAAMIVDPHDLIAPADMTSPDSAIRIRGVRAFREGKKTSTATDQTIEARIAE